MRTAEGRDKEEERLKTLVEEQETKSSAQTIAAPPAAKAVHVQPERKAPAIDKPAAIDGYETCLELAAQFIARG